MHLLFLCGNIWLDSNIPVWFKCGVWDKTPKKCLSARRMAQEKFLLMAEQLSGDKMLRQVTTAGQTRN